MRSIDFSNLQVNKSYQLLYSNKYHLFGISDPEKSYNIKRLFKNNKKIIESNADQWESVYGYDFYINTNEYYLVDKRELFISTFDKFFEEHNFKKENTKLTILHKISPPIELELITTKNNNFHFHLIKRTIIQTIIDSNNNYKITTWIFDEKMFNLVWYKNNTLKLKCGKNRYSFNPEDKNLITVIKNIFYDYNVNIKTINSVKKEDLPKYEKERITIRNNIKFFITLLNKNNFDHLKHSNEKTLFGEIP